MDLIRWIAVGMAVALGIAGALNYIPGLTDAQGRAFGVFALDPFDDALHFASATWAGIAAFTSRRASEIFLKAFGTLYCLDGLMGLAFGSGYLDLGIIRQGVISMPFTFKIMANAPHILLGGIGVIGGFVLAKKV